MNLVIDIGNTKIKWAVFRNKKMIEYNSAKVFSNEYFQNILSKYSMLKTICVSNTGEDVDYIYKYCLKSNIKYILVHDLSKLPVEIQYKTKNTLGPDRIALAAGAVAKYSGVKLIIDLGTCITYDIIVDNVYVGGQISLGLTMRLAALHSYTHRLPNISFQETSDVIGMTTRDSMLIGVRDSFLFEIKNVIEKYKSRYANVTVITTGGDMMMLKNRIKNINFFDPYLLMEGLNYIIACNEET
ncbi:MAG: pantothenate kinase [Flavobacteriales bacterium]|nr:pantothenate kinase [Flavobacteriales bacterium]